MSRAYLLLICLVTQLSLQQATAGPATTTSTSATAPASYPADQDATGLGSKPGDVYWETIIFSRNNQDWRVTDNNAVHSEARKNLPNATWLFQLPDLTHSIRAELTLDRTSEHLGTTQHRVRFNPGIFLTPEERKKELRPGQDNTRWGRWIPVPHVAALPDDGHPENHNTHDNITIEIPIDQLRPGLNTMQRDGTTGEIAAIGGAHGQWGARAAVLRVYFDPLKTPHAQGKIVSPSAGAALKGFGEENIEVQQVGEREIQRVDVLAYYYNYDVDGDGIFLEYQEAYHQPHNGDIVTIREHVGTATFAPYVFSSLPAYALPEQEPGSVKLIARVQDREGFWSVTEEVKNLSLDQTSFFIRLYQADRLPRGRTVFKNTKATSCTVTIPESPSLAAAESAVLHLRTWNGMDADVYINSNIVGKPAGTQFGCTYRQFPVPTEYLKAGANLVEYRSNGANLQNPSWAKNMSILYWPGPGLTVRYRRDRPVEATATVSNMEEGE